MVSYYLQKNIISVSNRQAPINARFETSTIKKQLPRNRRSIARILSEQQVAFLADGIKRDTAFLENGRKVMWFISMVSKTTTTCICVTRDPRWDRNNSVLRGEFASRIAKCLNGHQPRTQLFAT